jgi:hypothetical protein
MVFEVLRYNRQERLVFDEIGWCTAMRIGAGRDGIAGLRQERCRNEPDEKNHKMHRRYSEGIAGIEDE